MRKLILFILLCTCATICAQRVERHGNVFIQPKDTISFTGYEYQDKNGNKFPIYLSSKKKAFIMPISKKTGKAYRRYLPVITEELKNLTVVRQKPIN